MTDFLRLLELIDRHLQRAQRIRGLLAQMHDEGRTDLTPDELAQLKAADDMARQVLEDAIQRARDRGR